MTRPSFDWTNDAAVEMLMAGVRDGLSSSLIANRLRARFGGHITRNTVIGKIHRLGLAGRGQPIARKSSTSRLRGPRPKDMAAVNQRRAASGRKVISFEEYLARQASKKAELDGYIAMPEVYVQPCDRRQILARDKNGNLCADDRLKADSCRYIIGDTKQPDWTFCNGTKVPGLSYCQQHAARCHQPLRPARPQFSTGGTPFATGLNPSYVADTRTLELADK